LEPESRPYGKCSSKLWNGISVSFTVPGFRIKQISFLDFIYVGLLSVCLEFDSPCFSVFITLAIPIASPRKALFQAMLIVIASPKEWYILYSSHVFLL
jgi:hypothetical protein